MPEWEHLACRATTWGNRRIADKLREQLGPKAAGLPPGLFAVNANGKSLWMLLFDAD